MVAKNKCKIKVLALSFAIGLLHVAAPSQAVAQRAAQYNWRAAQYDQCFLDALGRQANPSLTLIISVKQSCARLASRDISAQVADLLTEGSINSRGELTFHNNSEFNITEVCILIQDRTNSAQQKTCQNDFVSNMRSEMSVTNPSQDQSFLLRSVTVQPFATVYGINIVPIGLEDTSFWKRKSWSFSSIKGF